MKLEEKIFRHICDREAGLNAYPVESGFSRISTRSGLIDQTGSDFKSVTEALEILRSKHLIRKTIERYTDKTGRDTLRKGFVLTGIGRNSEYYQKTLQQEIKHWTEGGQV